MRAAEAVVLFCYQVKKWIIGLASALGGLGTLVFAGGVGENGPAVRARTRDGMGFLGIELHDWPKRGERGRDLRSCQSGRGPRHQDERRMRDSRRGMQCP